MTEANEGTPPSVCGSYPISRRTFLAGLVATMTLPLPADAQPGTIEPFSFGYVTDVHLATGMPDTYKLVHESQLFLQDVVKALNHEDLAFVIFGGDQVENLGRDQANWQLFLDVVQQLNAPWSFVLGEHDIQDVTPVDKMRTYGADWKGRGIEVEHPYWSHNPLPRVHIVGLDTSRPQSPMGDMSRRQLDWLKADLQRNQLYFTIVFSHHPLLPPPPYDGGPPWDELILPQGPSVREILSKFPKVRLAVNGHVHVSKVQQESGIWYVSCPSLAVYPCRYRIFRVSPDSVTIETYQVSYPALIKKARKMLETSTLAYKYDQVRPERFVAVVEGGRADNDALLLFTQGASPQPLPKRKKKGKDKAKEKQKKKAKEPRQARAKKPSDKPAQQRKEKGAGADAAPKDKPAELETGKPAEPETGAPPGNGSEASGNGAATGSQRPDGAQPGAE